MKKKRRKNSFDYYLSVIGVPHTMGGEQGIGSPAHFFLDYIEISAILKAY
jgi:hypothetical protein